MSYELDEQTIGCPYCGEPIRVMIDSSAGDQQYIEDCQVCCSPIEFHVVVGLTGSVTVSVSTDRE